MGATIASVLGRARGLAVLGIVAIPLMLPAPAAARPRTIATVFHAFTSNGKPSIATRSKSGYCFTGSLTINRNDAWRCIVGNSLYDPCFSSAQAPGVVICPDRQVTRGTEIHLTRPLPRASADPGQPSLRNQPWDIELFSGRHFQFSSGASNVVHGLRLNYFCGSSCTYGLWGFPRRRTQPWTILVGPFTAKTLHQRRAIRHVWM